MNYLKDKKYISNLYSLFDGLFYITNINWFIYLNLYFLFKIINFIWILYIFRINIYIYYDIKYN